MADLLNELTTLERQGWDALSHRRGAEFYDTFLTDDAVMVLPFAVLNRSASIDAIREAPPWSRFELADEQVIRLSENVATLLYRATALREGQPEYRALMSTTYVRIDGAWLVKMHQQTPLPDEAC